MGVVGILVGLFWIGLVIYTAIDWIEATEELAYEVIKAREEKKRIISEALFRYAMVLCVLVLHLILFTYVYPSIWNAWGAVGSDVTICIGILDALFVIWFSKKILKL